MPAEAMPGPILPPGTLYEPSVEALHRGYLETLGRAAGKPLAADAPIFSGNAIQWHGNSYAISGVSLLLLGASGLVYENEFDPHARVLPEPRMATAEELAGADGASAPAIHLDRARLLFTAPLPLDTALCTPCHAPGDARRAALVYSLRELADD